MNDTTTALQLLHTRPDPRRLAAWAARHGLMQHQGDLGYALHGLLRAVFGGLAPQPFHYVDADQGLLAYLRAGPEQVAQCVALADADAAAALGLVASPHSTGYSLRPFPTAWPAGHVLAFDVRVRPVLRTAQGERDAFLCAVDAAGDPSARERLNRADIYAQWLRSQLAPREGGAGEPWQGAVALLDVHMTRYQRLNVMRKTQSADDAAGRKQHVVAGPDVELSGHLQVVQPEGFAALLERGVGRHRAFGFGMLRLRRAER
jgi:CRISPR system Cascade subunit CasE